MKFIFCIFEVALAHGDHVHHAEPELFVFKWPWDPTLLLFLAMAIFYARGLIAYRGKAPVALWQKVFFFMGVAVLTLAYLPPIDPISDQLFSMHMLQHLLITSLGVPLMIFGAPFVVAVRGLPLTFRQRVFVPFVRAEATRKTLRFLRRPAPAALLYEGVFWFWHLPKFYNLALLNDAIHLVEHACMALAALNLWRLLIDPKPIRSPIPPPIRILLLGLMTTLDMALSAALTYSEKVWYAYDRLPMPSWWLWDRLEDQRLGGVVMWVPGGMVWIIAMAVIFFAWVRRDTADEVRDALPATHPSSSLKVQA